MRTNEYMKPKNGYVSHYTHETQNSYASHFDYETHKVYASQ